MCLSTTLKHYDARFEYFRNYKLIYSLWITILIIELFDYANWISFTQFLFARPLSPIIICAWYVDILTFVHSSLIRRRTLFIFPVNTENGIQWFQENCDGDIVSKQITWNFIGSFQNWIYKAAKPGRSIIWIPECDAFVQSDATRRCWHCEYKHSDSVNSFLQITLF